MRGLQRRDYLPNPANHPVNGEPPGPPNPEPRIDASRSIPHDPPDLTVTDFTTL